MVARSLIQGRSYVLGVVAYGLEYFGPSRILTAIERQAAEMGYGITLNLILEPETGNVDTILNNLGARQVDGIIWAIPEVGTNRVWSRAKGSELPVPVILVGGMSGQSFLPSIGIDNAAIGTLATEHLLAGGARNVGIITGPLNWWEAQQRLAGWQTTLESHGHNTAERMIAPGDWTVTSGELGLHRLLSQFPEVDAVFASNDQMALGVLHAAHSLGLRVPEQLSVVGVDNIAEASHFWPPLTSVDQPLADAGALAVREMDQAIRRARQPRRSQETQLETILLRPELIVRDSSRRIPGREIEESESERQLAPAGPNGDGTPADLLRQAG
jgi:LacI family transcriptional regulator